MIGVIGATEQLLIIQFATFLCGIYSNEVIMYTPVTVPLINYVTNWKDLTIFFACISGVHYNLENIIVSIMTTKEKGYALCCLLPYVQFFGMMYASSFSQLYAEYVAFFLILCGFYLTYVTALFNLCSTASAKYNWIFFEPFIFFALVYFDATGALSPSMAKTGYISFFALTMIFYLMLMNNIVRQITSHMGLHFLKVKSKSKTDSDDKKAQ